MTTLGRRPESIPSHGKRGLDRIIMHPTARYHLDILREVCERFLFVADGGIITAPDLAALARDPRAARYLGTLLDA